MRLGRLVVVPTLALAALVSACGGSPTSPSCTTVASCQAVENPTPSNVPPTTVASVAVQGVKLDQGAGASVPQNADGSYTVPVGQWFSAGYVVNNPQAEGRNISFGFNSLDAGDQPPSDNFSEPARPAQVYSGYGTLCNQAGRVIVSTLSGSETGGNLAQPTTLTASVTIRCQ